MAFRSNRRSNYKRNNNYSNSKSRNKGNITQQYNKYYKLAKEAGSSGDRIQSEYYYQFTDHYYRLMVELGISFEENSPSENKIENSSTNNNSNENEITYEEKKETTEDSSGEINQNLNEKENLESIESVPFISEPPKKKTTKTKKVSA